MFRRKYNKVVKVPKSDYYVLEGQKIENGVHVAYKSEAEGDDPKGWTYSHYYRGNVVYCKIGIESKKEAVKQAKSWLLAWDYNLKLTKIATIGKGKNMKHIEEYSYKNATKPFVRIIQRKNKSCTEFDIFSLNHEVEII